MLSKHSALAFCLLFLCPAFSSAEEEKPAEERTVVESALGKERRKLPALERQENLRILYYKPVYFAYGNPSTKVQFSFRSPLIQGVPLNFAYSQIIFWDLLKESKPFLDATYNPEFFYRLHAKWPFLQSIDFGIWEHNSNGKAGKASRSYDQSYVRFNYAFEGERWITELSLKLRTQYNPDDTNVGQRDHVGPLEIQLNFLQLFDWWLDETEVMIEASPGGQFAEQWDEGGYSIGLSFRLGPLKVVPAFYMQYYHGFSETLINMDESVDEYRVGFVF